jgi:drug/metabolite transporter (DMT)-like permease
MLVGRLAALSGAIGWALTGVIIKPASPSFSALQITAAYSWVAFAVVLPVVAALGRADDLFVLPARSAAWLLGASVLYTASDLAFFRLLMMGAVGWTFVTTTSLYILFALVAGIVFLGNSVTWTAAAGAAAIVTGIYLINRSSPAGSPAATTPSIRVRLPIAAAIALCWTSGLLFTDIGVADVDPFTAAAVITAVPAVFYALLAIRLRSARTPAAPLRDRALLLVSALAFGGSAIAFTVAVKYESAGITAVLTSSAPLFAVLLAIVFLKERTNALALVGVGLCLVGIAAVLVR